jgi:hypothetical protein
MPPENLRTWMTHGDILAGTFMETPAYEMKLNPLWSSSTSAKMTRLFFFGMPV